MWTPRTNTTKNLTLWITHQCNLHCPFCRDSGNKNITDIMTFEEIKSSLEVAKEKGITTVLIGGGEPTLHPDIIDIAKLSKNMGFETVVTTNYTRPKIVEELSNICDTINVSVYPENIDNLPYQKDFKSILYFKSVLWSGRFKTRKDFDEYIDMLDKHSHTFGFCMMRGHSKWCREHKEIDWLDDLKNELDEIVMTDRGNPCWVYRGHPIDRKDISTKRMHHMMVDSRGWVYNELGVAQVDEEILNGETTISPKVD
ncbi:MAG: radical SAM protein [Campylobacter sp.]|nr:radical SAM protein [Campylobacter sp.]